MHAYYTASIEEGVMVNRLYEYILLIGLLSATFITFLGVVALAYLLSEGSRLIVSSVHESRRIVVEELRKCRRYYLGHSREFGSIGTTLRKLLTASL